MKGRQKPCCLTQPTLGAVSHDGPSYATGGCEAQTNDRIVVTPTSGLGGHSAYSAALSFGRRQEIGPLLQTLDGRRRGREP